MSTVKTDVFINKTYTCSVSGHREFYDKIDKKTIKQIFISIIEKGIDTFLVGMAVGFDTLCFKILQELKYDYNFRIIACVPCENQDKNFSLSQKKEYKKMLEEADEKILINKNYTPYCMLERNRFMVDNSSVLVCYLRSKKGGTNYTYEYAKKQGIVILKV